MTTPTELSIAEQIYHAIGEGYGFNGSQADAVAVIETILASHPTPPASESSEEVVVDVSELRDGEENDGALRSMDLQLNGRGIDVLVNTPVGNRMTYAVMVDGKMQSSGTVAPEQPVAEDAEAFFVEDFKQRYGLVPDYEELLRRSKSPETIRLMSSYARHASARAVEAEHQRLERLVDEHIHELSVLTTMTLEAGEQVTALKKVRSWLAGEGENA